MFCYSKELYVYKARLNTLCSSLPQRNGLSSEAVYTWNGLSDYTLMDKGVKRTLGWSYNSWLFFCLLTVFEMQNCKKLKCFKMCFGGQLDQSRFWNIDTAYVSTFLTFPCYLKKLSHKTNYMGIILGGLDTCCLNLKNEYYLMNWHFPVEDITLAILQNVLRFMLCLLWECKLAELNDIQEGKGHLLSSRKVSVLFRCSESPGAV